MSGDQAYYYDSTTGLPFLIPVPINHLPPPHPPPSSLGALRPPEPAPLGSFQNPYPANSIIPPTLPQSTSTSTNTNTNTNTTSSPYAPASAPSYGPQHQPQTAEIPPQYFHPPTLPFRCDTAPENQQRDTASMQENNHVSSSWWRAPPIPSLAEPRQQQPIMLCSHCGQASNLHPAHALPPASTTNPTLFPPNPQRIPQPQPHPYLPPSTYPKPNHFTTPMVPSPPPRLAAATAFPDPQDQILDHGFEYELRKWADCHVCNEKPALREKEGVLFCLGCWAEAEKALMEMERGRGRER